MVSENTYRGVRSVLLGALIMLLILPIPITLRFVFSFFWGLVLMGLGAYLGILLFDTTLQIAFVHKNSEVRYWIMAPLLASLFLLICPSFAFWVGNHYLYLSFHRTFNWFGAALVFTFVSIVPLILGPIFHRRWQKRLSKKTSMEK